PPVAPPPVPPVPCQVPASSDDTRGAQCGKSGDPADSAQLVRPVPRTLSWQQPFKVLERLRRLVYQPIHKPSEAVTMERTYHSPIRWRIAPFEMATVGPPFQPLDPPEQ